MGDILEHELHVKISSFNFMVRLLSFIFLSLIHKSYDLIELSIGYLMIDA